MNSTVTPQPQPLYQISPPPRVGALSVEVLSYILLGLGGILPVVFLLAVAIVLRCYRRHNEARLDRWKDHISQDRFLTGSGAKGSHANRSKTQSDLDNLSFSLQDSDLSLEPYFVAVNRGADLTDTADYPYPKDLKRSVTNANVYFKDDDKRAETEVDSAIADSEPSSSLTDHQWSASSTSTADYRIQDSTGHAASADSGQGSIRPPLEEVTGRRATGHSPGVIMGVSRLMDSTGRANDRANRNTNTTTANWSGPPPPAVSQHTNHLNPRKSGEGGLIRGEEKTEDLGNDEEQVLRYFDDIHSNYLSYELDNNSFGQEMNSSTIASIRRNSNFQTTRL